MSKHGWKIFSFLGEKTAKKVFNILGAGSYFFTKDKISKEKLQKQIKYELKHDNEKINAGDIVDGVFDFVSNIGFYLLIIFILFIFLGIIIVGWSIIKNC